MYLNTVLQSITSNNKTFLAEDLYKLNEAIFNLPEEDTINGATVTKLFQAVQKVVKAYNDGKYDKKDPNFFYDYVALLSTMQNQHFFNQTQNTKMLKWLLEAVSGGYDEQPEPAKGAKEGSNSVTKDIAKLESENEDLEEQIKKLKAISDAVMTIQTFKVAAPAEEKPKTKSKPKKTKGKGKGKDAPEDGEAKEGGEAEAAPAKAEAEEEKKPAEA
mmetsp:Transcript_5192/g.14673  ORF Transcript_5192/g.14673 Transcript_5192/m.14673 type:complete len:216 (-) Transcript_5192:119-766(-)